MELRIESSDLQARNKQSHTRFSFLDPLKCPQHKLIDKSWSSIFPQVGSIFP